MSLSVGAHHRSARSSSEEYERRGGPSAQTFLCGGDDVPRARARREGAIDGDVNPRLRARTNYRTAKCGRLDDRSRSPRIRRRVPLRRWIAGIGQRRTPTVGEAIARGPECSRLLAPRSNVEAFTDDGSSANGVWPDAASGRRWDDQGPAQVHIGAGGEIHQRQREKERVFELPR